MAAATAAASERRPAADGFSLETWLGLSETCIVGITKRTRGDKHQQPWRTARLHPLFVFFSADARCVSVGCARACVRTSGATADINGSLGHTNSIQRSKLSCFSSRRRARERVRL